MADVATRPATYADLEKVPPHLVAEIVYGVLETHPRPAGPHSRSTFRLSSRLGRPFDDGIDGPGGWVFFFEPELHLGSHVLVPDLAGWRAERMPGLPTTPYMTLAPDWVCEVMSPSTRGFDRGPKRSAYAESDVPHLWLVDPLERCLEAFALTAKRWSLLATVRSGEDVRVPPFDAISFPLDDLFPFDAPSPSPEA
jgi:Uma2 family endonuclease